MEHLDNYTVQWVSENGPCIRRTLGFNCPIRKSGLCFVLAVQSIAGLCSLYSVTKYELVRAYEASTMPYQYTLGTSGCLVDGLRIIYMNRPLFSKLQ